MVKLATVVALMVIVQGYPVTGMTCTEKFLTGGSMTVFQHDIYRKRMAVATFKVYGNEQYGGFEITQYDTTSRTAEFTDPTTGVVHMISGSDAHHFTLLGKIIDGVATLDHLTNNPSNTYGIVSDPVVTGSYVNGAIHINIELSQKYSRSIADDTLMVTIDSYMNLVYFGKVLENSAVQGYLLGEATHHMNMSGTIYKNSPSPRRSVIMGEIDATQPEFIAWQQILPISSHMQKIAPSWYCGTKSWPGILNGSVISMIDDDIVHRRFYSDVDPATGETTIGLVTIDDKSGTYALITKDDRGNNDEYQEDKLQDEE